MLINHRILAKIQDITVVIFFVMGFTLPVLATTGDMAMNEGNSEMAMIAEEDSSAIPVIIEAESGTVGSAFAVDTDGDLGFVTTSVNYAGQSFPADTSRLLTYLITFPDTGYYHLYARIQVGAGGFDDDSFFSAL